MAPREYSHGAPDVLDPAFEPHGDAHHYHRGDDHTQTNNEPFLSDHHAPRASDRPDPHFGAGSEQEHIDRYRAQHDPPNTPLDLGHPQDRGTTRADAYAHTTDKDKSYRRRG
jgi:hypothetical protein